MTREPQLKVALVTGGAARVGRAIALHLARRGLDVAITFNTNRSGAMKTVRDITTLGRRGVAIEVDLAQAGAAERVEELFARSFDRLDALVNNAGEFMASPLGEITPEAFESQMRVNALAALLLTQKFTPLLGRRYRRKEPASAGRVVNIVDAHVPWQPAKRFTAYYASKAALAQMTLCCAVELAPKITVNGVSPGVVAWADFYSEDQRRRYLKRVPLGRAGTPEDVACAVGFLVLEAHYCTGQIIRVDGGRSIT